MSIAAIPRRHVWVLWKVRKILSKTFFKASDGFFYRVIIYLTCKIRFHSNIYNAALEAEAKGLGEMTVVQKVMKEKDLLKNLNL